MKKTPITHLIIATSSSNEHDSGDCDYALVSLSRPYVSDLLRYMEQVSQMHEADKTVYSLALWDTTAAYFPFGERLEEIRGVDGDLAVDVPRGEPILLAVRPEIAEEDLQRVDCQTVHVSRDEVWWTAYVKHSNIRIETAPIPQRVLLRVLGSQSDSPTEVSFNGQGALAKQAAQEAYSRPWTCPGCARVTRVTYEELAEVGSPICPDCDIEMVLV